MKRFLAVVLLSLLSAVALADPAGCGTWAVSSSYGTGTEDFGDQAGFCAAAAANAVTFGGTQVSCSAPTPYAASEVVNLSGELVTFSFVRNGCTAPPESAASAIVGTVVLQMPAFLDLTPEDGFLLAAAIVGVWASAFAWRAAIRALGSDNDGDSAT